MMTTVDFETEECRVCGIIFQVPEEFCENRQEDGQTFYCPNGHAQHYLDTEFDEIKELESKNSALMVEVRQLKCKLMGKVGIQDRIKMWWKGGLS